MDKLVKSALSKGAVFSVRIGVGVPSFVVVLASEVTLARFLRRTKSVEGRGFDARLIGRSGYMVAYRLDESQVTYRVLARALCK